MLTQAKTIPKIVKSACSTNFSWNTIAESNCGNLATYTLHSKENNNLHYLPQYSIDKMTWYYPNHESNKFRLTVTKTSTPRSFFVKPANCTDSTKIKNILYANTSLADDCVKCKQ